MRISAIIVKKTEPKKRLRSYLFSVFRRRFARLALKLTHEIEFGGIAAFECNFRYGKVGGGRIDFFQEYIL